MPWALALLCTAPLAMGELVLPEIPRKKRKKDKEEQVIPPQAVPVEVQITPGAEVAIPLKVYGWRGRNVRYLLRSKPKAGESRMVEGRDGVWTLHYRHNGDIPPEEGALDRFFFAAQDAVATSAPAEIRVKIVDFPPKFEIPEELRFGETYTGEPLTQKITIANRGGGLLIGRLFADAPWSVSPEQFQLERGTEQEVTVTFAPTDEQAFSGRITVAGQPEALVRLSGMARDAFRVEPSQLDLLTAKGGVARSGLYRIENRSDEAQRLTVQADSRLGLPEEIALPAGETVELPIRLGEDDLTGLREVVAFSNGKVERKAHVAGQPIGARLFAEGADFGLITSLETSTEEKTLTVTNRGGTPANVAVTAPAGVTAAPMRFDLAPGAEVELKVKLTPDEEGDVKTTLRLQANGAPPLEIPLTATVKLEHLTRSRLTLSKETGVKTDAHHAEAASASASDEKGHNPRFQLPTGDAEVPVVEKINSQPVSRDQVRLSWEAPAQEGSFSYQLEQQAVFFDMSGTLQSVWKPMKNIAIHREGRQLSATIPDLQRGRQTLIRIITISQDGRLSFPSSPQVCLIPARKPFFTAQRLSLGFFLLLGGAALWLRFRNALPLPENSGEGQPAA